MSRNNWEAVILHFKGDRVICNCGCAYYSKGGVYSKWVDGKWVEFTDGLACEGGCSYNQMKAREHVAQQIIPLLNISALPEEQNIGANITKKVGDLS